MKKTFTLMTALTAVQLMAIDFDFTAEPPTAKGKVPMVQLDSSYKIGGSAERSALHFNGNDKPLVIPASRHFTLDKGITVAFDIVLEKKPSGKKDLHMLLMKNREWLIGKDDKNRIYINFSDGKRWLPGYYCNADFSKPHRYVITISPDLKINIWCDGKLYHNGSMQSWCAKPAVGKSDVSIGSTWSQWGIKGELYRLKIAEGVLDAESIKGF